MKMIKFITDIDYMGREFKFNIGNNGETLKTFVGGISTIIQTIGFLVLLWYYGQDIYLRTSPFMIKSAGMNEEYFKWDVNSSNFKFAISLKDKFNNPITDPKYFYFEFYLISYIKNESGTYQTTYQVLDMEKCSLKHFNNETLTNHKLYNYFCIENNYSFGGQWDTDYVIIPTYFARRCNAETEKKYNITCSTNQEIIDKYKTIYLYQFIQKNLVNPGIYEEPIQQKHIINNQLIDFTKVDFNLKQLIFYSTAELTTDTGLLFEDLNSTKFLELEATEVSSGIDKEFGDYLAIIKFFVSLSFRTYTRTYIRLSDALANVGGIMSLFSMIIESIYSFYLESKYSKFLQECLLKLNQELKVDQQDNPKLNIDINNFHFEKQLELSVINKNNINKNENNNQDFNIDSSKEIVKNETPFINSINL